MATLKVLALGSAYLDINCSNFPFPEAGIAPETELIGTGYTVEPGGSAVNFARVLTSLGAATRFVGKVGVDRPGQLLAELLQAENVKTALLSDQAVATNLGINFSNPLEKTIVTAVGTANQSLEPQELFAYIAPLLSDVDYMYLGGWFKLTSLQPAFAELTALAKDSHVKIILDHARPTQNTTPEQIELVKKIVRQVDYYLPSRDEFMQVWATSSIEAGLRQLQDQMAGRIVVKDGANGAVTLDGTSVVRSAAFTVKPLHTIGAGDSFNAGFMLAQEQGLSLSKSMQFACATAALKISQPTLPRLHEVEALLAENKL